MWMLLILMACKPEPEVVAPDDAAIEPIGPYDVLARVDPFIGTGGLGAAVTGVSPGASVPHGMTLVGPDTRNSEYGAPGFYHFGGYHWDDDQIDGFSHTHSHGMGVNDFGAVHVMPRARWDNRWTESQTRSAPFDHGSESAGAGWYEVRLDDDGTTIAIAATPRGAVHRYRFDDVDGSPVVVFDLQHHLGDIGIEDAQLALDPATGTIEGYQRVVGAYSGRFGGLQTHFVATVDPLPEAVGSWDIDGTPEPGRTAGNGGGWLAFPAGTTTVTLRVTLSYVDVGGAWANHNAEVADQTYATAREAAETLWEERLSVVRVRAEDEAAMRTFHTAHYHTLLMPSRLDDVDGRFRWADAVHETSTPVYTDYSLWDTFRTVHPWLCLVHPDLQSELVASLVTLTKAGGGVPKWPLGHGYTGGMVGTPADQVFAETWLKGIEGWDVEAAWEASWAHANGPVPQGGRSGISGWLDRGWIAFEDAGNPASRHLEIAWSDAALAGWAHGMGRTEEADTLQSRAAQWSNTWDPAQGWVVGRYADGSFDTVTSPDQWTDSYVEGNAWHYRWYVPWDTADMVAVQHDGDVDAFHETLAAYWEAVYAEPQDDLPDTHYWHGNEPVLHYAALGSLTGDVALTAEPMRWIAENRYDDTPLGLDGNDDAGTLSAWYLFAALGLYPVAGTDTYALSAPLLDRVEIDHPAGHIVIRNHAGDATPDRVTSGQAPVEGWTVTHGRVLEGLDFEP